MGKVFDWLDILESRADDRSISSIDIISDRDRGIGAQLLLHLFEHIQNLYPAISLSVSLENPALRLYQLLGFQIVTQMDNSLYYEKRVLVSWNIIFSTYCSLY